MRSILLWAFLLTTVKLGLTARILAMLPFAAKSHHMFSIAIMKALAERGHQVVEYSPISPKSQIPNHTHVEVHTSFEKLLGNWTYEAFLHHQAEYERGLYGFRVKRIWDLNYDVCADTFNHDNVKKLIASNDHFDLVITQSTFGEESLLFFGHRFSAPTITLETFVPWSILNRDAGNALSIASVPDLKSVVFMKEPLAFTERILNLISISVTLFFYHYKHLPLQEAILRKNVDYPSIPPLADMVANVSLYLTNSHPAAVNYIQPYTPNIVPIGGITIDTKKVSIPQDVQSFMDNTKEGVIYFSLGTVVPTHLLPKEILQMFINVFKKLPQKVLWKIEVDSLPNLPKNVLLKKWLPQISVLGHPNCQLFITHGGLFSHHEAIYSGVPTVGIPFFADQPYNVRFSEHRGRGVMLDFKTLSENTIYAAITSVLTNPKYKRNALRLSQVYRDRPMSPANSAVFWVEYVIKHRGALHLRPAAATLSWYQLGLLDVISVLITVLLLVVITVLMILKKIFVFLRRGKYYRNVKTIKKND